MTEKQTLEEAVAGVYFNYACRALLGGGKGMYVMGELYKDSPESYYVVVKCARVHLLKAHQMPLERVEERERQLEAYVRGLDQERSN